MTTRIAQATFPQHRGDIDYLSTILGAARASIGQPVVNEQTGAVGVVTGAEFLDGAVRVYLRYPGEA